MFAFKSDNHNYRQQVKLREGNAVTVPTYPLHIATYPLSTYPHPLTYLPPSPPPAHENGPKQAVPICCFVAVEWPQ